MQLYGIQFNSSMFLFLNFISSRGGRDVSFGPLEKDEKIALFKILLERISKIVERNLFLVVVVCAIRHCLDFVFSSTNGWNFGIRSHQVSQDITQFGQKWAQFRFTGYLRNHCSDIWSITPKCHHCFLWSRGPFWAPRGSPGSPADLWTFDQGCWDLQILGSLPFRSKSIPRPL